MPSRGGQRKRKASERAAAAAAAAQEAQEAAVAAAAARGRGKENTKAKRARQQAEKVLRAHGVEPVAAADDPTGYAHVQQLAELNLKLQKAQNRGPEAAVRYRSTTPSPMKRKVRRRAVATVGSDEDEADDDEPSEGEAGDDEPGEGEDSDAVEDDELGHHEGHLLEEDRPEPAVERGGPLVGDNLLHGRERRHAVRLQCHVAPPARRAPRGNRRRRRRRR